METHLKTIDRVHELARTTPYSVAQILETIRRVLDLQTATQMDMVEVIRKLTKDIMPKNKKEEVYPSGFALMDISRDFKSLCGSPEKVNLVVLLLHDVTGLKKKDIRKLLEYGPKLHEIYTQEQDFSVNKNPKAKIGGKTRGKKKAS